MRINAENTAAVAIDFQKRLLPVMHASEDLVRSARILLSGLNALNIPVIVSRQYPKGIGDTISEIKEVTTNAIPCEKLTFSCCGSETFNAALQKLGKKNILICGVEAHVCVLQTALDLLAAGYNVALVTDCIGSRKTHDRETGIKRAERDGALLVTYEQILFELLGASTAPAFKTISALLR
ncbi:MAG: isochorismatase family protein [Desulfovibrio sp.]|jgi:nicotinamidase-related amidase|nr:isochorismatase family protein [Desulfovibrio sp.]